MRLLLDTHLLIWAVSEPERLPIDLESLRMGGQDRLHFSAVAIWEIAIKFSLRKPSFTVAPEQALSDAREAGFVELPITSSAATRVASLPPHNRDPFDRLLVAQAIDEDAILLTVDAALAPYGSHVRVLGPEPTRKPAR